MDNNHQTKLKELLSVIEETINTEGESKTYGFVISLVPLNQPDLRALTSYLGSNIPNPVTELVLQQSLKTIRSIETPHDVPADEILAS